MNDSNSAPLEAAFSVLIAHEVTLIQVGIERILSQNFECSIQVCDTAEDALSISKAQPFDVVICSFSLPQMGSLELINRFKSYNSNSKIVVISNDPASLLVKLCFENGVSGYVTSAVKSEEFVQGIRQILNDEIFMEGRITQKLAMDSLRGENYLVDVLSSREFDIFLSLVQDKSVRQIAKDLFLAEKTIANNVSAIKKKLNVQSNAGLLEIAIKEGLAQL